MTSELLQKKKVPKRYLNQRPPLLEGTKKLRKVNKRAHRARLAKVQHDKELRQHAAKQSTMTARVHEEDGN